jgi:hypothetical protein
MLTARRPAIGICANRQQLGERHAHVWIDPLKGLPPAWLADPRSPRAGDVESF